MDTIVQWNCRGLKTDFDELSLVINEHSSVTVCLLSLSKKITLPLNITMFTIEYLLRVKRLVVENTC